MEGNDIVRQVLNVQQINKGLFASNHIFKYFGVFQF